MHLISTINAKTQATEDVSVLLVNLDGERKFLPRPETYKDLQRIVRSHYEIDSRAVLKFNVSTLDVCEGQDAEVTESAYPSLAPFLDVISVVIGAPGRDGGMRTPAATPPLPVHADSEDQEDVQPEPGSSTSRRPENTSSRVESDTDTEDEEVFAGSRYGADDASDSASTQDDDDEEDDDAPHTRRVLNSEFPAQLPRVKAEPVPAQLPRVKAEPESQRTPTRREETPRANTHALAPTGSSRAAGASLDRTDSTASRDTVPDGAAAALDRVDSAASRDTRRSDARFKIYITGPRRNDRAEFMTRRGHSVRKVLAGACKTFGLDEDRARLMLCVRIPEDGEMQVHHVECNKDETVAQSGVMARSELVVFEDED
ncbi:hypothetical protein GGX14DRAFT_430181, partial [Mycena pura]